LSAETYVFAHGQRDLVWQKEFCDESWIILSIFLLVLANEWS
jgi:hypothetical protein